MANIQLGGVVFVYKLMIFIFSLSIAVCLQGCGETGKTVKPKAYGEDGYMGLSNSNPNFRTNPTHHNYRKDQMLMRQALREMDLDKQTRIFMNGTQVTVFIRWDEKQGTDQAEVIRSKVFALLKGHVPRYDYKIVLE
jgi:hypothetical protein